jgi:acetyltransferase
MTFTIQHYPVYLIDVVEVATGRRATVRPVLPQDAEPLRAFFGALSEEACYFRFMTKLRELPKELAERFACVDYCSRMALVAEHFIDNCGTIVGEARYVANEVNPNTCEFSIAVADDWQRLGLGQMLLGRLLSHATAAAKRLDGSRCDFNQQGNDRVRQAGRLFGRIEPQRRLLAASHQGSRSPARAPHAGSAN